MMGLTERLFIRTNVEKMVYLDMIYSDDGSYTHEEIMRQHERFRATFQIIEEAGLEDAYERWVEDNNEEYLIG